MHYLDLFSISTEVVSKCHSSNNAISIVEVSRNCKAHQQWQEGRNLARSLWNIAADKTYVAYRKTLHATYWNSVVQFVSIEVNIFAVIYIHRGWFLSFPALFFFWVDFQQNQVCGLTQTTEIRGLPLDLLFCVGIFVSLSCSHPYYSVQFFLL